ncbi:TolC family outer membrane protein [Lentibacter sp. XHP0401]|uniref:TolC family outer membrane protein n=1 Tax=Lentibacter sp. XHP0401 TaxID=2984334 RepID=UPI0021E7B6DD|nr:TolC family outer membrane protein [Lentibacter sp. XHP0401]MCV2892822.1 TolC family outer membrane protein [Lentibacter sp. XHP0401]
MRLGYTMKSVRNAAVAVSAVALLAMPAAKAHAETLADAMVGAYKHSGLMDKNRALLRAADEDVAAAMAALRPIVAWSSTLGYSYSANQTVTTETVGSTIGLVAELMLYDGGASKLNIEIAKETVLATRETLVSVEQQVLLSAVNAFFDVRRANEFVQLRRNNLRVINEELRAARDRFEVGEVTRTDVSLAEARLAAARAELASAQGDLARGVEAYRAAVGRKPGNLVKPGIIRTPANTLDAAKGIALRTHPDLKRVQHQVSAAELGIMVAEAAKRPTVTLSGRLGVSEYFNSTTDGRSASLGLEANQPIYQGGRLSALERKSRSQRDAVRGDLHVARQSIAQNVGNAWALLEVSRATVVASTQQVRASEIAFRGVREEATLGARTTLDVLDAEQELLNARVTLLSAQIDEVLSGYTLLASMGLLTAERLNLNVPSYDPAAYYNLVKTAPTNMSKQGRQLDRVLKSLGKE